MSDAKPQPRCSGRLAVGDGHEIYWEEFGDPQGPPAVYLHGGPGGGLQRFTAALFDAGWRVLLFDQRGCGQSTPHASLDHNSTWDLVADIERLRQMMEVDKWLVCGGSWGSSLALAYAQRHPQRVTALVLRGVFMLRPAELAWFYQEGANWLYPDLWEQFIDPIPKAEHSDLLAAYYRRLTGDDRAVQLRCARSWSAWELTTLSVLPDRERQRLAEDDKFALAFARIEAHYFANGGFFDPADQLLADAGRLAGIPGTIIHGRMDVVTPLKSAWQLHKAWPASRLRIIEGAGHAVTEPGISDAISQELVGYREAG
ncbi:MAG: prolyl aminopeptidase [Betaproteobacteria bacterium]|nr:prolyl aminopeptidase [Betaproteobacteria bacterium]